MQNSWLFFSNLGLHGGYPFISAAESYPTFSYSSERWLGLSLFLNNIPNHSGQIYVPGNLSPGVALAPLPHMTGGFFFWLMKRRNTDPATTFTKSEWWQELNYRKWYCFHKNCTAFDIAKGNVQNTQAIPICKSGTRSVILERVTPIMSRKQWTGCQHYPSFPVFMFAAAFVRLLNNLSSKLLAIPIDDTTEKIMMERHESVQSYCIVKRIGECNILHLTKKTNRSFRDVVEPSTGIRFPTDLLSSQCGCGNSSPTSQVLVGVGSRSTMIAKVKPVKVYAFGL
ncbi:hypothetical protein KI387_015761, partial [Taxus chinensis]